MVRFTMIAVGLLAAGSASAQLLGTQGQVGATVGAVGQSATGSLGTGATVPNPVPPVAETARSTARAADRTADHATRTATSAAGKSVKVEAGASVCVAQGTRCYYDDYYYDPVYRDGVYYCERTGPGAAANVKAGTNR